MTPVPTSTYPATTAEAACGGGLFWDLRYEGRPDKSLYVWLYMYIYTCVHISTCEIFMFLCILALCVYACATDLCVGVTVVFLACFENGEMSHKNMEYFWKIPRDLEHRTCIPKGNKNLCSVLSAIPITSCYSLISYNPCMHLSLWTWFRYPSPVNNIEYLSYTGH